jgi:hypothetical protein
MTKSNDRRQIRLTYLLGPVIACLIGGTVTSLVFTEYDFFPFPIRLFNFEGQIKPGPAPAGVVGGFVGLVLWVLWRLLKRPQVLPPTK